MPNRFLVTDRVLALREHLCSVLETDSIAFIQRTAEEAMAAGDLSEEEKQHVIGAMDGIGGLLRLSDTRLARLSEFLLDGKEPKPELGPTNAERRRNVYAIEPNNPAGLRCIKVSSDD